MKSPLEEVRDLAAPLSLDQTYLDFVCRLSGNLRCAYGDRRWTAYDVEALGGPFRLGRITFTTARAGAAHAKFLREIGADEIVDQSGAAYGIDRLARGFCIGEDNGAPLFIDADSGEVFVYHGDGTYVDQWAPSVAEFVAGSRSIDD